MKYLKIGICDDEKEILDKIYELIKNKYKQLNYDIDILKYSDSNVLLNDINDLNFDIVFLDIDMPKINGIELAKLINFQNSNTIIIFITNKNELVFESFKARPFRFIRKSKLVEELDEAIIEICKIFDNSIYKMSVKVNNTLFEIDINSIIYIESSKNYIIINTINNKQFKCRGNINDKENELDKYGFIRTHVGYLVNQKYIQKISDTLVFMENNKKVPISRRLKSHVQKKMFDNLRF